MWRYGGGRTTDLIEQVKKDEKKRLEEVRYFQALRNSSNQATRSPPPALTEQELDERSETSTRKISGSLGQKMYEAGVSFNCFNLF